MREAHLRTKTDLISKLILKRLAVAETRTLALTVAIRGDLNQIGDYRGDLSKAVRLTLARLVKAKRVHDADGSYSLVR